MIQYTDILRSNEQDEYSRIFTEAVQTVQSTCHVNALGGAEDLYKNTNAFKKYVEKLTEGFSAKDAENLTKLLENNRMQVLSEASLGGIPPITALNCPTIVKMWAKSGLKNVIPTQVVDKPVFSVLFSKPYMIEHTAEGEVKHYLPEALVHEDTKEVGNKEKITIELEAGEMGQLVDLKAKNARLEVEEMDFVRIVKVGEKAVDQKMSLERRFFLDVDGNVVLGQCDLEKRNILLAQTGEAVAVTLEVGVSSAQHTRSTEISFEVEKRDFEIPTGEHFEANMPLEFVNDMYALYKIDSAAMATETMSNVINQKLEQEIDEFLTKHVNAREDAFHKSFNVKPMMHFAIQPKDWLEEIKRVIDYLANQMKTQSYFYQGYFVIYGNPVDVAILPNVSWSFNSASDNVNGINVNYTIGAMSGANKYVIVSSDLVKQGALKMVMIPTVQDYKTFMYYPYTFNIVNNYLNAQGRKTMPNLMMTKRHTMAEFMNLTARIDIEGNDGVIGYQGNKA